MMEGLYSSFNTNIFMFPEGKAYSRRHVLPSFRPSQFCPEFRKNIDGIWLKLDTLIETSERKCSTQEP